MCELEPLKNIPRKAFRFKRSEYGYTARYQQYEINIGDNKAYWWWDVTKLGNKVRESDDGDYKKDALTYKQAKDRAIIQLNKWRKAHV